MDTKTGELIVDGRRRRRVYTADFRGEAVAECQRPGVSIAAVALARGLNANLLRRWVVEAEGGGSRPGAMPATPAFVPVRVEAPRAKPAHAEPPIRIEMRKGGTHVVIEWPTTQPAACVVWLRDLLR